MTVRVCAESQGCGKQRRAGRERDEPVRSAEPEDDPGHDGTERPANAEDRRLRPRQHAEVVRVDELAGVDRWTEEIAPIDAPASTL
jgi:hypothetical protein